MEVAAENLRKLAMTVETESWLNEKKTNLKEIEKRRKHTFGTQGHEQIVEAVDGLYQEYIGNKSTTNDELSRCDELEIAIDDRINGYSAAGQRHIFLTEVAESKLKSRVHAVRTSSVKLAGSLDPQIAERLAILQTTGAFVDGLGDKQRLIPS